MARPHLCPVCLGKGTVPAGFYGHGDLTGTLQPETCRTCSGFGMVWDYTDNGGPGWGWVGPIIPQDISKTIVSPTVQPDKPKFTPMGDDSCNTESRP